MKIRHGITSVFTLLAFLSCDDIKQDESNYSDKFYKTLTNGGIELRNDSLLFPRESGMVEPILIPTVLVLQRTYVFKSDNNLMLELKRLNFTDIEYKLYGDKFIENGKASLPPTFHLGAESVKTDEGEFWVTDYEVEDSEYIQTIRIGDEGLADEKIYEVYVYVIPKSDCGNKKLIENQELWRLRVE